MSEELNYSEVKAEDQLTELEKLGAAKGKKISKAQEAAIREAAERRALLEKEANMPKEFHGRKGPEPVRYGDWEKKGIAVDF